jgi:hypothetical protein
LINIYRNPAGSAPNSKEKILKDPKRKVLILGSKSIGRGDETLGFEILVNLYDVLVL